MLPLVDQLIEHARIGMLRGEAQAQQFQAHARHLIDQAGIIEEPPAAEDMEVAEFTGEHAKFMLVLAR